MERAEAMTEVIQAHAVHALQVRADLRWILIKALRES